MSFLLDILLFCLGITFLVLVHILGHYFAARLTGVPVTLVSIGFGSPLIEKNIKGLDVQLCRFPFGGYIKYGDGADGEIRFRDWKKRIVVYLAGPLASMLLTFLMLTVFFIRGYDVEKYRDDEPRIGYVEKGSPADMAGLRAGDIVYEVNSEPVERWGRLTVVLENNQGKELNLVYERDSLEKTVTIKAMEVPYGSEGDIGIRYGHKAEIVAVREDSPAAAAGFETGDVILEIDDQPFTIYEVANRIGSSAGKSLQVRVLRGNEEIKLTVAPETVYYLESEEMSNSIEAARKRSALRQKLRDLDFYVMRKEGAVHVASQYIADRGEAEEMLKRKDLPVALTLQTWGAIGVDFQSYMPMELFRPGVLKSIDMAFFSTTGLISLTYETMKNAITGGLKPEVLSGPISVRSERDRDISLGFLLIFAVISMQLALINLLPIPSTDGGSLLIRLLETRLQQTFGKKLKKRLNIAGIVFIVFILLYSLVQLGKVTG